jgi:c-di-AMP phosphodiesterase-like protein
MTYYSNLDDGDRTGTIALYKTSYMAQLEHKMKEVIQHYDLTSKRVYSDNLQRLSLDEDYFDFMDMIEQHFTTSEQQQIGEIVEKLILYKGNTPTLFYDEIVLDKYCGITIYVPTREKYLLAPRFYGSQWAKNSFYQKLIENTFNVYQN